VSLQRKTQKPLLKQSKPQLQPQNKLDDNDDIVVDDEVTFGRNRKAEQFGKVVDEDPELSDYVKFRLWLARQLAMRAYEKAHA
jgi:hypothetical protein